MIVGDLMENIGNPLLCARALLVLGIQIVFSPFLLSILGLRRG